MLLIPTEPTSDVERFLSQLNIERLTGLTGTSITLEFPVAGTSQQSAILLFKNNAFLIPTTDYTISGKTITLSSAAVSGDVWTVWYMYRQP
jgi:hypothetical protein